LLDRACGALSGRTFVVLAGGGNNGGDGFVVARHLFGRGANVRVFAVQEAEEYSGDAKPALASMLGVGVRLESATEASALSDALSGADIIVDALLGTGTARPLEGLFLDLVRRINAAKCPVVSLDLPTGIDAESGAILGAAVVATHTVTFAHLKKGLLTTHGHASAGTITVSNIGVPAALPSSVEPSAWLLEEADLIRLMPERSPVAHKGSAGRVTIVGGSDGIVGAPRLSAHAALRTGAGLVTIASEEAVVSKLETEVREIMTRVAIGAKADSLAPVDALVVGPGLGRSTSAAELMTVALSGELSQVPKVLDADALRWLARQELSSLPPRERRASWVLTPHAAEAADLLGASVSEVENDRFKAVRELCDRFGCVTLLKGSRPLVAAPDRQSTVSAFGTEALATGGSGDVLSGILAAFLVGAEDQEAIFKRTQLAVGVQGICAERWSQKHGNRGLLASEIADLVPELLADWSRC